MKEDKSIISLLNTLFASKKAKAMIPLFILSLISVLYLYQSTNKVSPTTNTPNTPITPAPTLKELAQNVVKNPQPYFLRKTQIASSKINSLYWFSASPFYAVDNSIYAFTNSSPIYTHANKITPVVSSYTKGVVFKDKNNIEFYDPLNNNLKSFPLSTGWFYSPSFTQYVVIDGKSIEFFRNNKFFINVASPELISDFIWSPNENYGIGTTSRKNIVVYIDSILQKATVTKLGNSAKQIIISPDGKYFAVSLPQSIVIYQSDDTTIFTVYKLESNTVSNLIIWNTSNKLFLLEKQEGRYEKDLIYILNPESSNKQYVLDTFSTSSSINFSIFPAVSYKDDLLFTDKKGAVWVITKEEPFQNAKQFFDENSETTL
jgi:hypothetical protein